MAAPGASAGGALVRWLSASDTGITRGAVSVVEISGWGAVAVAVALFTTALAVTTVSLLTRAAAAAGSAEGFGCGAGRLGVVFLGKLLW
jgi:hypothetical protein